MMRKRILALTALFLTLINFNCLAQSGKKYNLDFEIKGQKENLAKGWFKWGHYDLSLDTSVVHSGQYAAKITSDSSGSSFGSVAYRIPADLEGESITLKGFMKIKNVKDGFAGLILRIDGRQKTLAFSNMKKQQVNGTKDWQKYAVTLPYPEEAKVIYLGGILVGKGKAWFDDFGLTIDGKNIGKLKREPKKVYPASKDHEFDKGSRIDFPEVDKKLVNKLALLGKIWGFLKYYHPAIQKGKYNWDYELFRFLPKYLESKNINDRNKILLRWIDKLGSVPKCENCPEIDSTAYLKPDLSWIKHSNIGFKLKKKLYYIFRNRYHGPHFYVRLKQSVGNPVFIHEKSYSNMSYPDEGFRLLSLYRYWNIIHYFYPYRKGMDKDWDDVLKEYIPKFLKAENELEYELVTLQIIADIQDTHANLWKGADKIDSLRGHFYAPFHVRFIERKLVVTDYYNSKLQSVAGLKIGDIITHINGRPVDVIVDSLKPYYPASNKAARLRKMAQDLLRSNNDTISIQYHSPVNNGKKKLKLYKKDSLNFYRLYKKSDQKSYKILEGNIGYIKLGSITKSDVKEIKEKFKNTNGIIIDIRRYPNTFVPFTLGSFFVSSATSFAKFTNGSIKTPGQFTFTEPIKIPAPSNPYKGKVVVIVNQFTQSQGEYTAMAFEAANNSIIIGSKTAAADGNVSYIKLPGGLITAISGIGVYYPDGTPTQRIGIVPDIKVEPTIKGIRKGKDELLEKAIEIINN